MFQVKVLLSDDLMNINNRNTPLSASTVLMELLKNIWQQVRLLASLPLLKYALLCWTIYFANMFGCVSITARYNLQFSSVSFSYIFVRSDFSPNCKCPLFLRYYGFGLWLPELFNRFENYHNLYPNRTVTVCKLIREHDLQAVTTPVQNVAINSTNVLINSTSVNGGCSSNLDEMVFVNSLTINAFCLLGNLASGYLANRVGRRTIPGTIFKYFDWRTEITRANHRDEIIRKVKFFQSFWISFKSFFLDGFNFCFSNDHAVGWYLWLRDILRQLFHADSHSELHVLADDRHGEFRHQQRRRRHISNERGRRRDLHDDLFR